MNECLEEEESEIILKEEKALEKKFTKMKTMKNWFLLKERGKKIKGVRERSVESGLKEEEVKKEFYTIK